MNKKISILITAWKEEGSIAKAIRCIADRSYSGISDDFELILAAPDEETKLAAEKEVKDLGIADKFIYIKDEARGKDTALNMMMDKAKGDIWILTDGDVWFEKNSVRKLLEKFDDENVFLVTGRPKSGDSKNTMMGYFGNLLADAAHHKRTVTLGGVDSGKSSALTSKEPFFPVSGYIYATRKTDIRFPEDCLVDDAYISYRVYNDGKKIGYAPEAIAYVKYPTTLKDYFKQKKRSAGGFVQLWKYGVVRKDTVTRSFKKELRYFWFPIAYAKNLSELFWSFLLFPIRAYQWLIIFWEQKVLKRDLMKSGGWERIESTK